MKKVLFLCTANYYRSRYAEHFFNLLAERQQLAWRADSCGLGVGLWGNLGPISRYTIEGLRAHGLELSDTHRSPRQVTRADLERAELVVAVKHDEHYAMVAAQFPDWLERIEFWQIDDLDCAEPDEALPILDRQIRALVERLDERRGVPAAGAPRPPAAE